MPTVHREDGLRFFFYSDEGDPLEPVHIHVRGNGCEAKFWLGPSVSMAYNRGFNAHTITKIAKMVENSRDYFEDKWNEHFAGT